MALDADDLSEILQNLDFLALDRGFTRVILQKLNKLSCSTRLDNRTEEKILKVAMALREDLDLTKTMNFSQMSSLVYILFWLEDIKLLNDMFEVVLSLGPHLTERTKRVDVIIEILPHLYNIQDIFSILQGVCTSTRLSCLEINKILQSCVYLPEHMQLNVIDCVFNVFHHQMDSDFYEPSNILQLVDDCLFRYNCCVERSALLHAKVVEILMLKSPQIEKVMLEHIDADVLHPFKKFLNSRINSDNENEKKYNLIGS